MGKILVLKSEGQQSFDWSILEPYYDIEQVDTIESLFSKISEEIIILTLVPYGRFMKEEYLKRGFDIYQHPYIIYSSTYDEQLPATVLPLSEFSLIPLLYAIETKINTWSAEKLVKSMALEDNIKDLLISGKLLETVSHDFGNALTIMLGFAEELVENVTDEEEREFLVTVQESVKQSYNLVRRLISFRNLKYMSKGENFDLVEFLESGRKIWEKFIQKQYEFEPIFQIPPGVFLDIDMRLIEYSILHFFINIKRLKVQKVTIAIYQIDGEERRRWKFDIMVDIEKDLVDLVPITAEVFSNEITNFKLIDPKADVNIVRTETETKVLFSFIVKERQRGQEVETKSLRNLISKNVLLLESDKVVAKVLERHFTKMGFSIKQASTQAEALIALSDTKFPVDAIVFDVSSMDDVKYFIMESRKMIPQLRIIAISAYQRKSLIDKGLLPKEVEFIQKPIRFEDIQQAFYN